MKKGYNLESWSESIIIEFLAGLLSTSNCTMLENLPGLCPLKCSIHLSRDMRFQTIGLCDQLRLRSACAYAQSDQSLC